MNVGTCISVLCLVGAGLSSGGCGGDAQGAAGTRNETAVSDYPGARVLSEPLADGDVQTTVTDLANERTAGSLHFFSATGEMQWTRVGATHPARVRISAQSPDLNTLNGIAYYMLQVTAAEVPEAYNISCSGCVCSGYASQNNKEIGVIWFIC
jgi:hypothetical protein